LGGRINFGGGWPGFGWFPRPRRGTATDKQLATKRRLTSNGRTSAASCIKENSGHRSVRCGEFEYSTRRNDRQNSRRMRTRSAVCLFRGKASPPPRRFRNFVPLCPNCDNSSDVVMVTSFAAVGPAGRRSRRPTGTQQQSPSGTPFATVCRTT